MVAGGLPAPGLRHRAPGQRRDDDHHRRHRWLDRLRQQLRAGRRVLRRSEWHRQQLSTAPIDSGGVFLYDYGWEELTAGERDCDGGYDSLTVGGEDGDTILVGSMSGSNVVCSSDDEGGDWSDTTLGGSSCEDCLQARLGVSDAGWPSTGTTRITCTGPAPACSAPCSAPAIPAAPSRRPTSPTWPTLQAGPMSGAPAWPLRWVPRLADKRRPVPHQQLRQQCGMAAGAALRWQRPEAGLAVERLRDREHHVRYPQQCDEDPVLRSTNGGRSWDVTSAPTPSTTALRTTRRLRPLANAPPTPWSPAAPRAPLPSPPTVAAPGPTSTPIPAAAGGSMS